MIKHNLQNVSLKGQGGKIIFEALLHLADILMLYINIYLFIYLLQTPHQHFFQKVLAPQHKKVAHDKKHIHYQARLLFNIICLAWANSMLCFNCGKMIDHVLIIWKRLKNCKDF